MYLCGHAAQCSVSVMGPNGTPGMHAISRLASKTCPRIGSGAPPQGGAEGMLNTIGGRCDSGSGDRVGGFKPCVVGVGPQVGFIIPIERHGAAG